MMKIAFCFKLEAFFDIPIFVLTFKKTMKRRLDKKCKINYEIYDVTNWATGK